MGWEESKTGYADLTIPSGGIDASSEFCEPIRATSCRNVYFKDGLLRSMYGAQVYVTDAVVNGSAVTGLYQFRTAAGSRYVVATCGTAIKYLSGSSWVDITGGLSVTANAKHQFAVMNDKLIGTSGVDSIWAWTGSGNAALLAGSPPKAFSIATYRGHLLLGNCTVGGVAYPQRVYRSGVYDTTAWDTTNDYWNFETRTASPIRAVVGQQSRALALKEDCIGVAMGGSTTTFSLYPEAYPGVGCVSTYAVGEGIFGSGETMAVGCMFPGLDGLYFVPEGGAPQKVSLGVEPHYRQLDMANMTNAVGAYYGGQKQYLVFAPSTGPSGENEAGYLYNAEIGGTWPIGNVNATACCIIRDDADMQEYMLIGLSNGRVLKMMPPIPGVSYGHFDISNAGPLDNFWQSAWFDLGNPTAVKLLRELLIEINAFGGATLNVKLELRTSSRTKTYSGTITCGSDGAYPFAYPAPYARAGLQLMDAAGHKPFRWVRIRIEHGGGVGWSLHKFGIRAQNLGERRVR